VISSTTLYSFNKLQTYAYHSYRLKGNMHKFKKEKGKENISKKKMMLLKDGNKMK